MECIYGNGNIDKALVKYLTNVVHKAMACIGCGVCESNCSVGALKISRTSVLVDTKKCVHCLQCHQVEMGCLRYYSKRYTGGSTMSISGINKYLSFGLNPGWISVLADEGLNFKNTGALGNRMIPSAITWFKEAGLIEELTSVKPTLLLDVGRKLDFSNNFFWKLIWMRLANISPLIKWFVCNCNKDENLTIKQIDEKLALSVTSTSVRKGALQSLSTTVKSSPIGNGENAWVRVEKKGRNVVGLMRKSVKVESLVVLYGLYLITKKIGKSALTIREMLDADFESEYISPLFVFGISTDEFKKIVEGLEGKYSNFIGYSFTLGLDEIRVNNEKSVDDVLKLILEDY
jgi:phosphoadenosine phosphosulfate reductase